VLRGGRSGGAAPLAAVSASNPVVRHRFIPVGDSASLLTVSGPSSREAALAAVACAWARWRGTPNAFLSTVGHGVPNKFRPKDRSRSVGWFTNAFPLLIPVQPQVVDTLPAVTDAMAAVPNDGVGYGILRHISPDTEAVQRLRALPQPELLVEHKVSGVNPFRVGAGRVGMLTPLLGTDNRTLLEAMPIVVSTAVVDGHVQLHLVNHGRFETDEMEAFAEHLVAAFVELGGQG
jgi:hypothetical protein